MDLTTRIPSPVPADPSPPPKSARLKGKERKLAKQAAKSNGPLDHGPEITPTVKCTITIQELLKQVDTILSAQTEQIRMPKSIQRVLNRAISARKRCATWFERTDKADVFSNESHRFFIGILEKAAEGIQIENEEHAQGSVKVPANPDAMQSVQLKSLSPQNSNADYKGWKLIFCTQFSAY